MAVWLIKLLHFLGLTNLSNAEVERYANACEHSHCAKLDFTETGATISNVGVIVPSDMKPASKRKSASKIVHVDYSVGIGQYKAIARS